MSETRQGRIGEDLEQAMRSFEAALAEADRGRHADPDEESPHLAELRMQVIRRAEALPSACWPRSRCAHCRGEREVTTVAMSDATAATAPLTNRKRLCPQCGGAGLALRAEARRNSDRPDDSVM